MEKKHSVQSKGGDQPVQRGHKNRGNRKHIMLRSRSFPDRIEQLTVIGSKLTVIYFWSYR